jgi:hypothetical protein
LNEQRHDLAHGLIYELLHRLVLAAANRAQQLDVLVKMT